MDRSKISVIKAEDDRKIQVKYLFQKEKEKRKLLRKQLLKKKRDYRMIKSVNHLFKILCCNMKPCAVQQMKYENWTPVLCGAEQFPVCPATGCLVSSAHFGKNIQIFKLCCIRGTIPVSRNGCVLGQPSGCLYIVSAFKK